MFERPDGVLEPSLERLGLAETAQQRHRQMAMGIHQPRHQDMAVEFAPLHAGVAREDVLTASDLDDRACANGHAHVLEDSVFGSDRQ